MYVYLVSFLMLAPVFANASICDRAMPCGRFAGKGIGQDEKGKVIFKFTEEISIQETAGDELTVTMDVNKGKKELPYKLVLKFDQDNHFKTSADSTVQASGVCNAGACTYGMRPDVRSGEVSAFTGSFHFSNEGLKRFMTIVQGEKIVLQKSALKKLP